MRSSSSRGERRPSSYGSVQPHAPALKPAAAVSARPSKAAAAAALEHAASLKYVVLLLCSALGLGSSYCYHSPAALKNQLQQHFSAQLTKDEFEVLFSLLYTVYSTPNIVLPFLGGLLVDKIGARQMLLMLAVLVFAGQTVLAVGTSMSSFRLMLAGRIIFGLGGESLGVARTAFIATWFKKRELALALGVGNSVAGLASILNTLLSPYLANQFGTPFALWFGATACGASLLATMLLIPIDRSVRTKASDSLPNDKSMLPHTNSSVRISDVKHFGLVFWMILVASVSIWGSTIPFQTVSASVLLERDFFRRPPTGCNRCGEGNYASYTDCHEVVPSCPPSPPFAWPLPKISASCQITRAIDQLYCTTEPPYIADSEINCDNPIWKQGAKTQLYCEKKIEAEQSASRVMSLPSLISLFASPLFGYGVDHAGNRAVIAIATSFFVTLSHLGIIFPGVSIWLLLFIQGIASCLYFAAIWPSIPYVVEEHHVGSAYGAIISFANLVLAVLPMAVAAMYRIDEKYLPNAQLLLSGIGFCAFVASCLMLHFDQLDDHALNPPTPKVLTKAQAVAQSFEETDFLLDFHDHFHNQEELSKPSRTQRSHRD